MLDYYSFVDKIYKVNEVWHYANDHIPTMSANNASIILSNAILPYLIELSNKGTEEAILENKALGKGTIIAGKKYTHEYTCTKRNLTYYPVEGVFMEIQSKKKEKNFLKNEK